MRDLVSPLGGFRSPFGALSGSVFDPYAVAGFNPDLVFDFAAELYRTSSLVSTFDDSLTYTGASAKTMVDSDGLVKWAPHNLILQSNDFDTTWTFTTGGIRTDNGDGSWTLDNDGTSSRFVSQSPTVTGSSAILAIEAKPGTVDWISIRTVGWATDDYHYFDLTNGVVGSIGGTWPQTITATSDGFYLCTVEIDTSSDKSGSFRIYMADGDESPAGGSIIVRNARAYNSDLGGMVDNPDRGDSYVPTTSAAVYLPRRGHYIYNGNTWVNEGIQLESEARTNLYVYSHEFDNAAWLKFRSTVTPDTVASPDGSTNADTLTQVGTTLHGGINQRYTSIDGTTYTWSAYVKAGTVNFVAIAEAFTLASAQKTWFNLSTGAVGTTNAAHTANIESLGNGWYRCSITFVALAASVNLCQIYIADADNDTNATDGDTIYIYGAQLEAGSTPSSYIPTSGATVTRSAETLTVAAANLPYSSVNMSIQMDGEMTYAAIVTNQVQARWFEDAQNYIQLNISPSTTAQQFLQESLNVSDSVSVTFDNPGVNTSYNIASRHGATFLNGAVNGTAGTANLTPVTLPDLSATNLELGYDYMGTIGKFRMWDDDLGDAGIATASARTYTTEFAMIVATTTPSETFTIPCQNVGTFNATIDWGDNSEHSTITAYNDADLVHTYNSPGDHVIRITGTFPNIYFNDGGDKLKVKSVENLGTVGWLSFTQGFFGCSNMTSFTAGTTDTSAVTTLNSIFRSCTSLTTLDLTNLDVSAVIDFAQICNGCTGLTSVGVSNWDTSSAESMGSMFRDCTSLTTLDVSNFNTAAVTTMSWMFQGVQLTSLDLSNFNTALVNDMNTMFYLCNSLTTLNVSSFNTALVTNMVNMFRDCTSLTTLDVSNFNTAAVTTMQNMFYNSTGLTDIIGVDAFDIGGLNTTASLTTFAINVTLPTARYDALLIAWEAQDPFDGMAPNFGSSTYTGGGAVATAHASLISRDGWTITDGGIA